MKEHIFLTDDQIKQMIHSSCIESLKKVLCEDGFQNNLEEILEIIKQTIEETYESEKQERLDVLDLDFIKRMLNQLKAECYLFNDDEIKEFAGYCVNNVIRKCMRREDFERDFDVIVEISTEEIDKIFNYHLVRSEF